MRVVINALQMKSVQGHSNAGLSRYAFNLIDAIVGSDSGHEFTVFTNRSFEVPSRWTRDGRFQFKHPSGPFANKPHAWGQLAASFYGEQHDVWFSLAHTLPLWSRSKRVLTVHDLFSIKRPELYEAKRARITAGSLKRGIKMADLLVAVSEATKHEIMDLFGVGEDRILVTPLAPGNQIHRRAPASVSDEELRRIGVPFERFIFVLSTVEPRKNMRGFMRAFARILDKEIGLVIGGGKGWEQSDVYQLPADLGVGERVKFLGYVADQDLPALFARCEAFVLPSFDEGFGITIVEAMQGGAPVACSNTGALPEVGGNAVLYFDPNSIEDMASKVEDLLGMPRQSRIEAGFHRGALFTWPRTAELTLQALEQAVGHK